MRILEGEEEKEAKEFMALAEKYAKDSTCLRSKCGALIVKKRRIISSGYNSPPGNLASQRRCLEEKSKLHEKITDKTCCIHAEDRAIRNALRIFGRDAIDWLKGSRMYFIRLNRNNERLFSGEPYCTACSKMALDVGISEWVLWHERGLTLYDSEEYNQISYAYKG